MGQIIDNFTFFKDVSGTSESNEFFPNNKGDILKLHVSDGGSFSLQIMGLVDNDGTYAPLTAFNDDMIVMSNKITKSGIYTISITGYSKLKAVLTGATSNIKVFGRVVVE